MSKRNKNNDSEVYILGANSENSPRKISSTLKWIIVVACITVLSTIVFLITNSKDETPEYYFEPEELASQSTSVILENTDTTDASTQKGYIGVADHIINDVSLRIYIPHNATMSLAVGMPNKEDSTIIFTAMAADIRKDNEEIVGDFVLAGKQLARGITKKGFCAIINDTITIGTDEKTPLLEETIKQYGYFFRQYPLVMNGEIVENKPKNKSVRRAIAIVSGDIVMIESMSNESFHDFSQALVDLGILDAIYLVGGNAYGWYYNQENVRQEIGKEQDGLPKTISYIVWKTK